MSKIASFLLVVIASCYLCLPTFVTAQEVEWIRIVRDDTNLYATDQASKVVCQLEKSYYVEVLESTDTMYFVAVMSGNDLADITGYVWKNHVEVCDQVPQSPTYPSVKLTVKGDSASLKLSPMPSAEVLITATNTQQVTYYGKITSYSTEWYYVCFAGKFGYVESANVTSPNIPLHPTPLTKPQQAPVETPVVTPEQEDTTEAVSPSAEIVLIVFVALLAVALTLALFLPVSTKKQLFERDI